jgi:glycosyltransferase involved in cell wall biosynthesis
MIRILHIVSNLRASGTTTQLYNLLQNIDKERYEVYILTLSDEDINSRLDEFSELCTIIQSNISRVGFWFSKKKMYNIIDSITPDIIHSHTFRPDYINAFNKKRGFKTVSTIHSHSGQFFSNTYGFIGKILFNIHKFAMKRIDCLASCSKSVQEYTESILGRKSLVIYNGTSIINTESEIRKFILNRNQSKIKRIIYVGSLTELKNVKFLIDSFISINKENNYELILVGDGPLLEYTKSLKNESIIVPGSVRDISSYLIQSHLFISASTSEGLPMAVIEAMSYGLPVLLSDIPSHKEIVKMGDKVGYIFKNNDFMDFSAKLELLLSTDYEEIALNAFKLSEKAFNAEKMSETYEKLYDKLSSI